MNAGLVIDTLIKYYGKKSAVELAVILGTTDQNISKWRKRNTLDILLISTKCPEINMNWVLREEGSPFPCKDIDNDLITYLKKEVQDQKDQIQELTEEIGRLKGRLEEMQKHSAHPDDDVRCAGAVG